MDNVTSIKCAESKYEGIFPIHVKQLAGIMPRLIPLLERVVKPETGHTVETVLSDLFGGFTLLWVMGDFEIITITRIQDRATERVLWNEWTVGDNLNKWSKIWMETQETYARSVGCRAIEFHGRLGYKKRYEKHFPTCKPIRTLYRQELA